MLGVLDNKCPACNAKINFNPANQKWDCEYCGSKFTLEEMQQHSNASTVEANTVVEVKTEAMGSMDMYHCNNCGAEIIADENTTSTFCVYCGSTAILKNRIDSGRAPNYIIPFKKVKDDAVVAFKNLFKHKPLTPKCFKDPKNIQKITGVYIPFWAYDLVADGQIDFEATDVTTWSDSSYRYTKTSRYSVKKSGHFDFDKVLSDASSRFPNDLMDSIEPFNYQDLVQYNHAYLSGFLAEKYDVDENAGLERARERTMLTCVDLVQSTVGHQSKRVVNNSMNIEPKCCHYIMLPVWMVSIQYKDKNYTFAMNGQTGKIVGNIPIGVKETITWSIIVYVISLIIFYLGMMVF